MFFLSYENKFHGIITVNELNGEKIFKSSIFFNNHEKNIYTYITVQTLNVVSDGFSSSTFSGNV